MKATDSWGTGDGIAWNGGRRGTGFFLLKREARNAKREMRNEKCETRNAKREMLKREMLKREMQKCK